MSTYEALQLMLSASMFVVSLISLIIALVRAVTRGKK